MELTTKNWNGHVYGTNTGKLAFSLTETGNSPKGLLRFMDDNFGVVIYDIKGTASPDGIKFEGKPTLQREDIIQGDITIDCKLTPDGNLGGQWSSTIGTGGTFIAYPFDATAQPKNTASVPEQIFTKRIQLGFVQLYKNDIEDIVNLIRSEFSPKQQVVVTYQSDGKPERINYFNDFINVKDVLTITYLKLFISEPERQGVNRGITLELRAFGMNELMVQGMTESWVLGRSQITADFLKKYEDKVRNNLNKFFPALYLIILLGMVLWMTTLESVSNKVWLGLTTFIILYGAPRIFMWLFPNAIIIIGEEKPKFLSKLLQKGGNWIAGFGIVVTTLLVERYAERVVDSIQAFIDTFFSSGAS